MERCPVNINTIITGFCASGATMISVCGAKRYITPFGSMLIHQMSRADPSFRTVENMKDDMIGTEMTMDHIINIYQKHSKMDKKTIKDQLKHDIYWNAEKCLKMGLVDEIKLE
jgi:ATP-dependent protease ClpP protease subunit